MKKMAIKILYILILLLPSHLYSNKLYKFDTNEVDIIKKEIKLKLKNVLYTEENAIFQLVVNHAILINENIFIPILFSPKNNTYGKDHDHYAKSVIEFARLKKRQNQWDIDVSFNKEMFDAKPSNIYAIAHKKIPSRGERIVIVFNGLYGANTFENTVVFYKIDEKNICIYDKDLSDIAIEGCAKTISHAMKLINLKKKEIKNFSQRRD